MRRVLTVIVLVAGGMVSAQAAAERVRVPLTLDGGFLAEVLASQQFTEPGGALTLDDGSGCQSVRLSNPELALTPGLVTLTADAYIRTGRRTGDRCLLPGTWAGRLEAVLQPRVTADRQGLNFRTSSWRLLRADGSTATVNLIARALEGFLPVRLETVTVSFAEPLTELRQFLIQSATTEAFRAMADSVAIDRVRIDQGTATVSLGIDAPAPVDRAAAPEAALSRAELALLEARLDELDGFFTYTVRTLGLLGDDDPEAVEARLATLVVLRRDLLGVLADPKAGNEAVRNLFVGAWENLTPALVALTRGSDNPANGLRYLGFVAAGDALAVLTALGPAVGIEITSDGLRRLARLLLPADGADPLERSDAVDPALRKSLGFGEPIPPPMVRDDGVSQRGWLEWLIPVAHASLSLDPELLQRLNTWVPKKSDIPRYLPMVREVLRHAATRQIADNGLADELHGLFRALVLATAWQESCWRQFVAENNMRVPMRSGSGDLGIMQINPRVWRGLYDLHGLRWDIAYNARAGADILHHYLTDYARRHGEHRRTGSVDNLARSAYAAYNGGPRAYDRYRRADAPAQARKIDALFFEKYRAVRAGQELAVRSCYGG